MTNSDRKSIFFVTLPKSGTVYTWNSLSNMTGLKMPEFHLLEGWDAYNAGRDFSCPALYACGDYNTQLLLPEQMKRYLNGYIFGAHMQASYHNIKILEESGIDRVTVLLRDPRDAFVSWVHHLRQLGPAARNFVSKIYHIPRDYYAWSLAKQFDFQVRSFLPVTANWVEGWLDYYASQDRKIDLLLVLYDELKRDPAGYIRKIVEFHQIEDTDYTKLVVPEKGKFHFRKGEHGQWKAEFSAANQLLAADLLQDRIALGFEAAARSHRRGCKAEQELAAGNAIAAAEAAVEAIVQFPNCSHCYEHLFRAAEVSGLEVSLLRDRVKRELDVLSIGDYFIYRDALIVECQNVLRKLSGADRA